MESSESKEVKKINSTFKFFEGTVVPELTEKYINVLENIDENAIGIEMEGYDEITREYFLNKILEVRKAKKSEKLVIGAWPKAAHEESGVLNCLIENKEEFSNLKSLCMGDMDHMACELCWIIQNDYAEFLKEYDKLEHLTIIGARRLAFSTLDHKNLKSLEIITGGLPKSVIYDIADGNLPNLEKLVIYIGSDYSGFDGDIEDIKYLMDNLYKFPNLKTLGILNSQFQDDIVKMVVNHPSIENLEELDLSYGTFTDMGAKVILENKEKILHLKTLGLRRSFLSQNYYEQLSQLDISVDLEDYNNVEFDWEKEMGEIHDGTNMYCVYSKLGAYPLYAE